jgi:hypothetical protein
MGEKNTTTTATIDKHTKPKRTAAHKPNRRERPSLFRRNPALFSGRAVAPPTLALEYASLHIRARPVPAEPERRRALQTAATRPAADTAASRTSTARKDHTYARPPACSVACGSARARSCGSLRVLSRTAQSDLQPTRPLTAQAPVAQHSIGTHRRSIVGTHRLTVAASGAPEPTLASPI